jgi:hypothetical protein
MSELYAAQLSIWCTYTDNSFNAALDWQSLHRSSCAADSAAAQAESHVSLHQFDVCCETVLTFFDSRGVQPRHLQVLRSHHTA